MADETPFRVPEGRAVGPFTRVAGHQLMVTEVVAPGSGWSLTRRDPPHG